MARSITIMTKEDKQLLLEDLTARLPYNLQAVGTYTEDASYKSPYPRQKKSIGLVEGIDHIGFDDGEIYVTVEGIPCELSDVKMYLRPLSTMTEEERRELELLGWRADELADNEPWAHTGSIGHVTAGMKWLNSHQFDYNGLIEKGLALKLKKKK